MRPKSIVLLALALGCGLVASIGISQVLDRQRGPSEKTEGIYVAKVDINTGDPISADIVILEQWPVAKIPPGAIRELEAIDGERARQKLYAGAPIIEAQVGATEDAADTIPKGFRVVPVQLGKAEIGAGLLHPGNRVDVQLFVKKNPGMDIHTTKTQPILYNVRVFAVDQQFERSAEEGEKRIGSIVSLLVSPEDADRLSLAQRLGDIKLILRNTDDDVRQLSQGATVAELLGGETDTQDRDKERASTVDKADANSKKSAFLSFMETARDLAATAGANMPETVVPKEKAWTVEIIEAGTIGYAWFDPQGRRIVVDPSATAPDQDKYEVDSGKNTAKQTGARQLDNRTPDNRTNDNQDSDNPTDEYEEGSSRVEILD